MFLQDIYNTDCIRTEKGKETARMLEGFKSYIRDYTLIKEKGIEYVKILEEYIPYAIILNEASTIEEFVKNNESYRRIIYNMK